MIFLNLMMERYINMNTIRKYLAMLFLFPGILFMSVGFAIGLGFKGATITLEAQIEGMKARFDEITSS